MAVLYRAHLFLLAGDPGIGKSTLLLQVSSLLANKGHRVLYISGEESIRQTKLRAERLGVTSDELYIYAETDLEQIHHTIEEVKPTFRHRRLNPDNPSSGSEICTRKCYASA